jgi:hypothetical protein
VGSALSAANRIENFGGRVSVIENLCNYIDVGTPTEFDEPANYSLAMYLFRLIQLVENPLMEPGGRVLPAA